ncbi:MAG: 3D domain-containing protein [Phycisphaerales bacterium]
MRLAMAEAAAFGLLVMVVAFSAVVTKELTTSEPAPTLAVLDSATAVPQPVGPAVVTRLLTPTDPLIPAPGAVEPVEPDESEVVAEGFETDISIRYFNGRPVRPVRTIMMTVTAYSPDARSCGDSDDGITASLHDVYTNGFQLVAADTRLLPLGSMLTVPGYAGDKIVPVLDRGGKIKGSRLDVLYPTHETALRWGVKRLAVTIWQYADGKPADDWRRLRDSR